LEIAKLRGITDLGFSEHGYRFKQSKNILFNPWVEQRQTEDVEEYVSLILDAKKEGLPVKLGIEMDYLPDKEREIEDFLQQYPWDYVIGSVHWLDDWGFDLAEMRDKWENKSVIDVYNQYFKIIEQMLDSSLFDILGHVDVIKVFGHKPLDTDNKILNRIYDNIVNKIKASNITVEMSTAGLRKPVKELYPAPALMERLATNKVPMIINSDAHHPKHVGADYDKGVSYLKKYDINELTVFTNRKKKQVPLK